MSIKLSYIKEYLNLMPIEEITKISGSNEEYQTEVFSCLSFVGKYKNLENKLFIEIEENSFDDKYIDFFNKYNNLLEESLIDIPIVSTETIKKHFIYFGLAYKNFESLYILLTHHETTTYLGYEWLLLSEKDKPYGPEEWVEIQEDIYHFTKGETVKRVKEKFNECKPKRVKSKEYKKFEKYFSTEYQNKIHLLNKIFNKNQSPKEYAMMVALLSQKDIVTIGNRGRRKFYKAWYDFIAKERPKGDSFSGINDYIEYKENVFSYKYNDDPDYGKIEKIFNKEFVSN